MNESGSDVCPYLGSQDDPETALCYPSLLNRCYRPIPTAQVKLNYQLNCCLSTGYSKCMVFQRDVGIPPPLKKRDRRQKVARSKRSQVFLWMILGVIVIIGLIVWQSLSGGIFRFTSLGDSLGGVKPIAFMDTNSLIPTIVPTMIPRASTATLIPFSPSPTWTLASFTPTLAVFHALETPIGITNQFVIHRVQLGESLPLLAMRFGTTTEAIQWVNFKIKLPLLLGALIIIPVNQTDISGMPSFEAYMVEKDISVEALAKQLMVDPSVFESYNDLRDGQVLIADEWVLVPHISTPTP